MVQMQQVKYQNNTQSPSKAKKTANLANHQAISFIWHTCNPYLTAAQERGALAPMWEVKTAKMQANAGAVNAGLSEEERAAKAGYAAPVDAAYVAAHQADYAGKPVSAYKRVGSFIAVGLDLSLYSQKNSKLCPYDSDNGVKILKDWKLESNPDKQPKPSHACSGIRRRKNQMSRRKKWHCHRHMVIVSYAFISKLGKML